MTLHIGERFKRISGSPRQTPFPSLGTKKSEKVPTPRIEKPTFNSPRTVPRSIRHYLLKKQKLDLLKLMDES